MVINEETFNEEESAAFMGGKRKAVGTGWEVPTEKSDFSNKKTRYNRVGEAHFSVLQPPTAMAFIEITQRMSDFTRTLRDHAARFDNIARQENTL